MKKKINNFLHNYMKWRPSKLTVILILFLPIFIFEAIFPYMLNNDFWFLINTGKYILNNSFPHIDPFTIHEGLSLVIQQWLTDVIFYLIYNKCGIYGIYVFTLIAKILISYLIYKLCMLVSENKVKLSMFITLAVTTFLNMYFLITTRPQTFDIIILLLEIYILEYYIKKSKTWKCLLPLPILSLILINLHCSIWFMLFIFLIPYYIERIFYKNFPLKPLIVVTIIMFLMGFINPYGISGITYIFNSYGNEYINSIVGEMKAININGSPEIYIYIFIIVISYIMNRNTKEKLNLRYLFLWMGTTYLCLSHFRGFIYFAIISILPLSDNFKNYFKNERKFQTTKKADNIICMCVLIMLIIVQVTNMKFFKEKDMPYNEIANYLDKVTNKNIKLYTDYNKGAYFEYRGYKCYIDPRAEVFLKKNNKKIDIMKEYYILNYKEQNYDKLEKLYENFLQKYDFDYLIVEETEKIDYYLEKNKSYELVYTTPMINKVEKYKLYKHIKNNN